MTRLIECPVCQTELDRSYIEGVRYYMCVKCFYYCVSSGEVRGVRDAALWLHKQEDHWVSIKGIPVRHCFELKGSLRDFYSEAFGTFLTVKDYIRTHPGECEKLSAISMQEN